MRSKMKAVLMTVAVVAIGLVSGCGGGGVSAPASGSGASSAPASSSPPSTSPAPGATADGAILYESNCAGCHGALAVSNKTGVTLARLQTAISNNSGGMGFLSSLTAAQQQSIVAALTPVATTPAPTPTPTPVPTPTPGIDGAALYNSNCAGCHGALASSAKTGITTARLQNAITANIGNMGFLSSLTSAQQQAIVTALTPVATTPVPTPTPTPIPSPVTDGATLYGSNCAGCHGVLASSGKAGATAARIQTAINNNIGGMGTLAALSTTQVNAIATSLAVVTPSPTPAPAACGSCHAIPPATGKHAKHKSQNIACATCHGTGYSTTTVNAATHNNGVKNLATTIGWNTTSRSCSNSCHGNKSW